MNRFRLAIYYNSRSNDVEYMGGELIWWKQFVSYLTKTTSLYHYRTSTNISPICKRDGDAERGALQLKISCVELDACNMVFKISNVLTDLGETEVVHKDIKALLKVVEVQKCQSISINGNRVAYNFASLALSSKEEFMWQNVYLSVIFPCLVL